MSFLQPLLWLGALGVGVPIWLHLRAKTGPVFPFTALRFLEDQPHPRIHGFRLRDVLLFTARLLALLLVVAAFARPYRVASARKITESQVHILDNTLSQQVAGGFDRARARILEAVAGAGPEAQVAVVELTARPRVVVAFGDGREEAEGKLRALEPSYERGSYLEAFRLGRSLLSQSLGASKRIVVHGDHQENQWTENEMSPPFLQGVEVELPDPPREIERANLSVAEPVARLFFLGDKTLVDLSARLGHHPRRTAAEATIVIEASGRTITRQVVALKPGEDALTLRAQWETDPAEWLRGEVRLENASDALAADDRAYFCLPPVREGRIAMLARSPYLRAALAPETMKGRWATRALDPASRLADVAEKDLADVLVLEGDYAQSQQVRELAFRHLNNGRGVVLLLARATPLLSGFLRELGFEPGAGGWDGEPAGEGEAFRFFATRHPIFQPFASGELGDLTEARVFRHLRLKARQATPLIYGESGDGLLFEVEGMRGRLLVFGFGFDRAQTDWPLLPTFIPFLDLCLQHARASAPLETSVLPGELHIHQVPPDRSAREIVLRGADREIERAPVDDARRGRVRAPDRPGFYAITYDEGKQVEGMIAVNPSPKESVLKYVAEPAAIKAWTLPAASRPAASTPAVALDLEGPGRAAHERLWWWLLLAGGGLLALETLYLCLRKAEA